jgi:putative oxidoreductase
MTIPSATNANAPAPRHINLALLLLRAASAPAFLYHGSAILFGWFGGPGPERFAASHQWPAAIAYLVGLAQVAGGLAILSGILFRVGTASISIVMAGAIFLVHLPHGFDVTKGGVEYALAQLMLAGALLLTGPGRYSLASLLPPSTQKL